MCDIFDAIPTTDFQSSAKSRLMSPKPARVLCWPSGASGLLSSSLVPDPPPTAVGEAGRIHEGQIILPSNASSYNETVRCQLHLLTIYYAGTARSSFHRLVATNWSHAALNSRSGGHVSSTTFSIKRLSFYNRIVTVASVDCAGVNIVGILLSTVKMTEALPRGTASFTEGTGNDAYRGLHGFHSCQLIFGVRRSYVHTLSML